MSRSSIILGELRISFDDLDAALVVYHANYLKFLERARNDILLRCGWHAANKLAEGLAFAVVSSNSSFHKPLMMENYSIASQISQLSPRSIIFSHSIGPLGSFSGLSALEKSADTNFFNETKIVCVSLRTGRSIPIPETTANGLQNI